jgi:hypothetical protein
MIEWDFASYRRKFVSTWAYCRSQDLEPAWRYITDITDAGSVFDNDGLLGYVCGEEARMHGHICETPELTFIYKSVPPGVYWDKRNKRPFLLMKSHIRQYEVGIGTGGHMGYSIDERRMMVYPMLRWQTAVDPDFDGPCPHIKTEQIEVFNSQLYRLYKDLYCFKEIVGFMEDGVCFLRNSRFTSLVKPYLGEKWQIENL